jgi:hypothetical protein
VKKTTKKFAKKLKYEVETLHVLDNADVAAVAGGLFAPAITSMGYACPHEDPRPRSKPTSGGWPGLDSIRACD